jgi:hypothetical protein
MTQITTDIFMSSAHLPNLKSADSSEGSVIWENRRSGALRSCRCDFQDQEVQGVLSPKSFYPSFYREAWGDSPLFSAGID